MRFRGWEFEVAFAERPYRGGPAPSYKHWWLSSCRQELLYGLQVERAQFGGEGGNSKSRWSNAPTEGASPLVGSPRRGHIPFGTPVRIPPSLYFDLAVAFWCRIELQVVNGYCYGGEGGIRTHGRVTPTAVFETARFGRSRTSPLVGCAETPAGRVEISESTGRAYRGAE